MKIWRGEIHLYKIWNVMRLWHDLKEMILWIFLHVHELFKTKFLKKNYFWQENVGKIIFRSNWKILFRGKLWKRSSKRVRNVLNEGMSLWKWFDHRTEFLTIFSGDKTTWIPLWIWFLNDDTVTFFVHFERNICIFVEQKMFEIPWKDWFSWVWKIKIKFVWEKFLSKMLRWKDVFYIVNDIFKGW